MKAQKIITGMFLLLLGVTGCQDKWDAHYENENGGGEASVENTKNLLEYIRSVPDYSGFVNLLEETGIAPELAKKQILTVWIPVNGNDNSSGKRRDRGGNCPCDGREETICEEPY